MEWVYTYTRKQAIEDGILIDVTTLAKEAGFRWPVAVTTTVYHTYITPSETLQSYGQSTTGRLWDVLNLLRIEAKKQNGTIVSFKTSFLMNETHIEEITLKAIAGPGDHGEPVITIMLPEED
jgi:hypothetical protein